VIAEVRSDSLDSLDPELRRRAALALQKQGRGEKLSRDEENALKKLREARDKSERERLCSRVPKKVYREWSGHRQHKVLDEQAERYGLPVLGDTVDIRAVIKWLHEFLAKQKYRLLADDDDGVGMPASTEVERVQIELIKVRTDRERVKLEADLGELVRVSIVRAVLLQLASQLRAAGDRAERDYGRDARDLLNGVVEAVAAGIRKLSIESDPVEEASGEQSDQSVQPERD
jgi:hypothetical protein